MLRKKPWRLEIARQVLQRREPPQRTGSATQAKPACAGFNDLVPKWILESFVDDELVDS